MNLSFKAWIHSLAAAAISSAATALSAIYVDPAKFNFSLAGIKDIGEVAAGAAFIAIAGLLRQSPLPGTTAPVAAPADTPATK